MYVVLVYDVSKDENGRKRWSHIFKICKKYMSHIQNSVFEGELSKVQLTKMQKELLPYINNELDSVILFKSRQEKWLDKELWGKQDDTTSFVICLSTSNNVKRLGGRQYSSYHLFDNIVKNFVR